MLVCNVGTALALGVFFHGYGGQAERVFTNVNLVFCWIMYIVYGTLTSRLITCKYWVQFSFLVKTFLKSF